MSVVLYKKGNAYSIRGFDCDIKLIRPEHFTGKIEEGWFISPEDAHGKTEPLRKDLAFTVEIIDETAKEVIDYDKLSNPKIREHAKAAGIESWKDARIKTLRDELKGK